MKRTLITAAVLALATPALAQQSGSGQTGSPGSPQSQQQQQRGQQMPQSQTQGSQSTQGAGSASQAMTQSKLRETLQKAGFRNVQIVDAAYLVQAQTEDGQPVMMVINPPSTAGSAMAPGGASAGSGSSGSGSGMNPSTNR